MRHIELLSPAVAFLVTLFDGIPSTIGDRERVNLLHQGMDIAIKGRFKFRVTDGEAIRDARIGWSTTAGIFAPICEGTYFNACRIGGTYPAMYERDQGLAPWKAPIVLVPTENSCTSRLDLEIRDNHRVVPGFAVCLPGTLHERWFCTSISNDHIVLCQYHPSSGKSAERGGISGDDPRVRTTKVSRRLKLSREQWAEKWASAASTSPEALAA